MHIPHEKYQKYIDKWLITLYNINYIIQVTNYKYNLHTQSFIFFFVPFFIPSRSMWS